MIKTDQEFQEKLSSYSLKSALALSKKESNQLVAILLEPGLYKSSLNCESRFTKVVPDSSSVDELNLDSKVSIDEDVISTIAISLVDTRKEVSVTVDLDEECGNVFVEFRSAIDDQLLSEFHAGLTRHGIKKIKPFFQAIEAKYGR